MAFDINSFRRNTNQSNHSTGNTIADEERRKALRQNQEYAEESQKRFDVDAFRKNTAGLTDKSQNTINYIDSKVSGQYKPQAIRNAYDDINNNVNDQAKGLLHAYAEKYKNGQEKTVSGAANMAKEITAKSGLVGDDLNRQLTNATKIAEYEKDIREGKGYKYLTDEEKLDYGKAKVDKMSGAEKEFVDKYKANYSKASELLTNPDTSNNPLANAYNKYTQIKALMENRNIQNKAKKELGWDPEETDIYLGYAKREQNAIDQEVYNKRFEIDKNASGKDKLKKSIVNSISSLSMPEADMASLISYFDKDSMGADPNSVWNRRFNAKQEAQNQVSENAIGDNHPIMQATYGIGMSTLESLEQMALTGGILGKSKVAEGVGTIPFFAGSFSASYQDAKARGLNDDQAYTEAWENGIAEAATEMLPTEHLLDLFSGKNGSKIGKAFLKAIGRQGAEEAVEEGLSFASNLITDMLVAGPDGKSQYDYNVRNYMDSGMSEEEAAKKAKFDIVKEAFSNIIGGFVSGSVIATGATAVGNARSKNAQKTTAEKYAEYRDQVNDNTNYGKAKKTQYDTYANNPIRSYADSVDTSVEGGKEVKEKLNKMADKVDSGKKLSIDENLEFLSLKEVIDEADSPYKESTYIPEEHRIAVTGLTEEQARTQLVDAAKNGDIDAIDNIHKLMKNSTVEEVRQNADEIVDTYEMMAKGNGVTNEQWEAIKNLDSEEAFLAGAYGTAVEGQMTSASQEAYNAGTVQKIEFNTKQAQFFADKLNNEEAKNVYLANYNSDIAANTFDKAYRQIYKDAASGLSYESVQESINAGLLGEQATKNIYDYGHKVFETNIQKEMAKAVTGKRVSGSVVDSRTDKTNAVNLKAWEIAAKIWKFDVELKDKPIGNEAAYYDKTANKIVIFEGKINQGFHEIGEFGRYFNSEGYQKVAQAALQAMRSSLGEVEFNNRFAAFHKAYTKKEGSGHTELDTANEMANDCFAYLLSTEEGQNIFAQALVDRYGKKEATRLGQELKNIISKLKATFSDIMDSLKNSSANSSQNLLQAQLAEKGIKNADRIINDFIDMIDKASENNWNAKVQKDVAEQERKINEKLNKIGLDYDAATESVNPSYSLTTWEDSDYVQKRKESIDAIAEALGISKKKAAEYIDNINSIAKMIADDKVRLDYDADPNNSSVVSNAEYGASIDFSTICKKRLLYTGTMQEIQKQIGNRVITMQDYLDIRNAMLDDGLQTTCGCCYVEGSRVKLGQFMKEFIKRYAADNPAYVPTMYEVTMPDGIRQLRAQHPEVWKAREYFLNHMGQIEGHTGEKNLFGSQGKPKDYTERTEYRGELLDKFLNKPDVVEEKNRNGGLRLQSFSDFEIVNLIDCMQVIMDMSRCGLAGQAYTKVYEFADALGNTGLKINLSLMGAGVDANGDLILDEVNGMSKKDAIELRNKYSKNAGTIVVAFTDEQIKAAMKSDYVDYIIPFHRSQWRKSQYEALGLPEGTRDYTLHQNDRQIKDNGKLKKAESNHMPNEYWDFSKSGRENAEHYIQMCNDENKAPKFPFLLEKDANGKYYLPEGKEYDGYFKLLIDFKMYDNEGVGAPQMPVKPEFSMAEAKKMLDDYTGGHESFPVAQEIADRFAKMIIERGGEFKYSLDVDSDGNRLTENQAKYFKDTKVRDENGKLMTMYHGTSTKGFTVFDGDALFFTNNRNVATTYSGNDMLYSPEGKLSFNELNKAVKSTGAKLTKKGNGYLIDERGKLTQLKSLEEVSEWINNWNEEMGEDIDGGIYPVYLNVVNPLVVDAKETNWDEIEFNGKTVSTRDIAQYAKENGYDGAIINNVFDVGMYDMSNEMDDGVSTVAIAFSSNQAKSVDNLNPTSDPDIRYSINIEQMSFDDIRISEANQAKYRITDQEFVEAHKDRLKYVESLKGKKTIFPGVAYSSNHVFLYNNYGRESGDYSIVTIIDAHSVEANIHEADRYGIERIKELVDEINEKLGDVQQIGWRNGQLFVYNKRSEVDARLSDRISRYDRGRSTSNSYINKDEGSREVSSASDLSEEERYFQSLDGGQYEWRRNFSLDVDTEGNNLTEGQQKYFKNSKMRDENGALKVMYHGARGAGFTVFDSRFSDDERSLFFTDSNDVASTYSGTHEIFAPDKPMTYSELNQMISDYGGDLYLDKLDGDVVIREYGMIGEEDPIVYQGDVKGAQDYFMGTLGDLSSDSDSNYQVYLDLRNPLIIEANGAEWDELELNGKPSTTREISEYAQANGYDGVIFKDMYDIGLYASSEEYKTSTVAIAFNSNQIKSVWNMNPTDNGDIRYALDIEDDEWEMFEGARPTLQNKSILEEGLKALKGKEVDTRAINTIATQLKTEFGSTIDKKQFADMLNRAFAYLHTQDNITFNDVMSIFEEVARPVIDQATKVENADMYRDFTEYFKGKKIKLTDTQMAEVKSTYGSYADFQKAMYPLQFSVKGETTLDSMWIGLAEYFPGMIEYDTVEGNMPMALNDVLEALRPSPVNTFGANADEVGRDLAMRIVEGYLGMQSDAKLQKAVEQLRGAQKQYRNDVRARYQQRLKDYKAKVKDERNEYTEKLRKAYQDRLGYQQRKAKVDKDWALAEQSANYQERLDYEQRRAGVEKDWALAEQRQKYEGKLAEERANAKFDREMAKFNQKDQRLQFEAKIADVKAKSKDKMSNYKDRQKANAQKKEIAKIVTELSNRIMNPTENKHVPSGMVDNLVSFLQCFNFVEPEVKFDAKNKQYTINMLDFNEMVNGVNHNHMMTITGKTRTEVLDKFYAAFEFGAGSQNQKRWQERMQDIQKLFGQSTNADAEVEDIIALLDPTLAQSLDELIKKNDHVLSINNLSTEDLVTVKAALKSLLHAINKQNEAFTMKAEISDVAHGIQDNAKKLNTKDGIKAYNSLHRTLVMNMMTPDTFFSLLGDKGDVLYDSLARAYEKKISLVHETERFIDSLDANKGQMRDWRKEIHTFNTSEGEIKITTAQIMSLYELSKRKQAMLHRPGGFAVGKIEEGLLKRELNQNVGKHLSDAELSQIISTLTDEQIRIADALQKFMATECSKWGNEASLLMYDFEKYLDPDYFPIHTDSDTNQTTNDSGRVDQLNGIERMGFTKAVNKNAKNPIVIDDIFSVFTKHATDMAAYASFAPAIKDALRVYNFKDVVADGGNLQYIPVKKAINQSMGRTDDAGKMYFEKLIRDINATERSVEIKGKGEWIVGAYKGAAVGANGRVVVQQPTAYIRAATLIKPKYLTAALPKAVVHNMEKLKNENELIYWKSQGYYEASLGKNVEQILLGTDSIRDRLVDMSMFFAGKADDMTWACLYNAAQKQIKAENPGLTGDEYKAKVDELFRKVIHQTQVVDSTIMKSPWQRSKDGKDNLLNSFMAEPIKSYNMGLKAIIKANRGEIAVKAALYTGCILLTTDMANALAQAFWDAFRYHDDDDEYKEEVLDYWLKNMKENVNPLNRIPFIKDVFDQIEKAFNGESTYGQTSGQLYEYAALTSVTNAIAAWVKKANGSYNKTNYALYMDTAKAVSQFTGVPIYNFSRDAVAAWNFFTDKDLVKNIEKPSDKYNKIISSLDKDRADEYINDAIKEALEKGGTITEAKSKLNSNYKKLYAEAKEAGDSEAMQDAVEKTKRGMIAMGLSEEDANAVIANWDNQSITLTNLYNAIESGEGIEDVANKLIETRKVDDLLGDIYNKYSSTIEFNREYGIDTDIEENLNKALNAIGGYNYDSMVKHLDDKAAEKAAKEEQAAANKAEKEAKESLKNDLYNAIDTGRNYKMAVKAMIDDGAECKDIKKTITDQYKDKVVELKARGGDYQSLMRQIATVKAEADEYGKPKIASDYKDDTYLSKYYKYEYDHILKEWLGEDTQYVKPKRKK